MACIKSTTVLSIVFRDMAIHINTTTVNLASSSCKPSCTLLDGFRLISRAGNLAVVVVFEKPEDKTSVHAKRLEQSIQSIGGIVDGGPARVLVLTVPVSSGFKAIESLLTAFMKEVPGTSWWYGNVYEAGDPSRLLDWWKDVQ
jgi:hypothetical protein